jgi:hypothetical protein
MLKVSDYTRRNKFCKNLRSFAKELERGEWEFPAIVAVLLDHDRELQSVAFVCDCCVTSIEGQNIVRELNEIIAQVPTGDALSDCKGNA